MKLRLCDEEEQWGDCLTEDRITGVMLMEAK